MKEAIRQRARELGFDACRFTTANSPESAVEFQRWLAGGQHGEMTYLQRNAHKRMNPQLVLPGAKTIIALAVSYADAGAGKGQGRSETAAEVSAAQSHGLTPGSASIRRPPSGIPHATGVVARYARFHDYHAVLASQLRSLSDFVNSVGHAGTRSLWYVDTGPLLERDLAQRAGLGFIGKHTNVISRQLGNWIFLAEIITTSSLEPDEPENNRCGSCARCLSACPTGAIKAPFQLDARLCISYLTIELKGRIPVELRPAIGNRIYGCDDCLAVCPWNRFAKEGELMKNHARADCEAPDLIGLLKLDEVGFKRRFAGTPMLRAKRRGLMRNICVALGNIGNPNAVPALQEAATDPEPLIAEHARWALQRIADHVSGAVSARHDL